MGLGGIFSILAGPITAVIKTIAGVVRDRYDRTRELNFMEHERRMAVETRLRELALDKSSKDSLWALEQIRRSDKWMKRVSFVLLWLPLILGAFWPMAIKGYVDNVMAAVPDWYIMIFGRKMMAVWGIRELFKFWGK